MGEDEAKELVVSKGLVPSLQDIDTPRPDGLTALSKAALAGEMEDLKALLAAGGDVNAKGDRGMSALYHAITGGEAGAVSALLQSGADASGCRDDGNSVLMHACGLGRAGEVQALIDSGADVDYAKPDGYTALMAAVTAEVEEAQAQKVMKLLLAAGADPNKQTVPEGRTALVLATKRGMSGAVGLLVDAGADEYAMGKGAALELVLDMGLLAAPDDLDAAQTEKGVTPLGSAALSCDLDGVRLLLCAGADSNRRDAAGVPPLYHAVTGGDESVTAALLEWGADANAAIPDGNSVLMHASGLGRSGMVAQLAAAGADPNYAKEDGFTALMASVSAAESVRSKQRQAEIVRLLLDSRADPNLKNKDGVSALGLARARGAEEAVEAALEESGATE